MPHPVDIFVGKKLRALRLLRGLTQSDVGQALKISPQQLQKYELGRNRISASKIFDVSEVLSVSPDYFFDGFSDKTFQTYEIDSYSINAAMVLCSIEDALLKKQISNFIIQIVKDQEEST